MRRRDKYEKLIVTQIGSVAPFLAKDFLVFQSVHSYSLTCFFVCMLCEVSVLLLIIIVVSLDKTRYPCDNGQKKVEGWSLLLLTLTEARYG